MKHKLFKTLLLVTALGGTNAPVFGAHGTLSSNLRDAWINLSVNDLVALGLMKAPAKPVKDLSNMEVAQLTAKAGETLMAQADLGLPPALPAGDMPLPEPSLPLPAPVGPLANPAVSAAGKNMGQLVQEFREELAAMGVDLPQLEDRIFALQHRDDSLADLQQRYLKRTGTEGFGYSRGYVNNFRGFGNNAFYPAMDYNALVFMEMGLRSVPVPFVLFQTNLRFFQQIGMYYSPGTLFLDLRWISLTNFNEYATVTAGDFFQHYTPLTLWNYEVPVFNFIEPTSYYRTRKDVEELVFMNHGTDWRLRGFQASTKIAWPDSQVLSLFKLHGMGGPLKMAGQYKFGDYFAGSQASMSFFNDNLEFKGAGLFIWDDPNTANVPYNSNFPLTFAKKYQIGSVSSRLKIPFDDDVSLSGSVEYAGSDYQDDIQNPQRDFQDWAVLSTGALNIGGFHLTAKYFNIGPYFYSPGAQTNRFTPGNGSNSYLATNLSEDDFLVGYLNRYPFQGTNRPSFAPYDRMVENMLPYGDATPNRLGMVAGISMEIGKNGWLKPRGSWALPLSSLQMHEIQANYVLNPAGNGAIAVDAATNTQTGRTFGGYEGAFTVDLAKALDQKDKTYQIAFDYKNQTTDLGGGAPPFAVNTMIGAADFTLPIAGFDTIVLSLAYEQAQASGSEYVLKQVGNPGTIANYPFYLDTSTLGQYNYSLLNITRTSLAVGFKYPLTKTITFRGDYFYNQYTWGAVNGYDRRDSIWRFTYEASF